MLLHGAHVTHWQPAGQAPVLWRSRNSLYAAGKPVRGGVPICWPWFGPHATRKDLPGHGCARILPWRVAETAVLGDGSERVELELVASEATAAHIPYRFRARLALTLGEALDMALTVVNDDVHPFAYEEALHTYFAVADVRHVRVAGLDGTAYLDKRDGLRRKVQQGEVKLTAWTDRVHVPARGELVVHDPGLSRRIRCTPRGAAAAVVWNPWQEGAAAMAASPGDYAADEWPGMICVESATCGGELVTLLPGTAHTLGVTYRVESE